MSPSAMRHLLRAVPLLAAVFAMHPVIAAQAAPFHFDGAWRVTRITGYSDESIGPDAARRLIGKTVAIGPGQVRIGDDSCVPDRMRAAVRATAPVLRDGYRAQPDDAGVPARTLVLDAGRCGLVFRTGREIVVYHGGAFYRASRLAQ